ncbi:hypothetical protein GS426_06225 [Rhodococcus hoagii]|nr:hypothetical protein [Prescottella equi]
MMLPGFLTTRRDARWGAAVSARFRQRVLTCRFGRRPELMLKRSVSGARLLGVVAGDRGSETVPWQQP